MIEDKARMTGMFKKKIGGSTFKEYCKFHRVKTREAKVELAQELYERGFIVPIRRTTSPIAMSPQDKIMAKIERIKAQELRWNSLPI